MQSDQYRQHISGQFNAELDAMKNHLLEMGGLVEQQLSRALQAVHARDSGLKTFQPAPAFHSLPAGVNAQADEAST